MPLLIDFYATYVPNRAGCPVGNVLEGVGMSGWKCQEELVLVF